MNDDIDDAPELTPELLEKLRPVGDVPALAAAFRGGCVSVAVDPEVVERFRAQSPDWPERLNAVLRRAVGLD